MVNPAHESIRMVALGGESNASVAGRITRIKMICSIQHSKLRERGYLCGDSSDPAEPLGSSAGGRPRKRQKVDIFEYSIPPERPDGRPSSTLPRSAIWPCKPSAGVHLPQSDANAPASLPHFEACKDPSWQLRGHRRRAD